MPAAGGEPWRKATYAKALGRVRSAVDRRRDPDAPIPGPDQRARHYLRSLLAIYDVDALVELAVPWWSYRAIDVVDAWLAGRGGRTRAFEYGSGASTRWLAQRCAEVHSVEHDASFGAVVAGRVSELRNVRLHVVPPALATNGGARSGRAGYDGLDFSTYVAEIEAVGGMFDLIVVDGRARTAALEAALPLLETGGLIVFDNADRARYLDAIDQTGLPVRRLRGLTPALPYPTTTALLGPR